MERIADIELVASRGNRGNSPTVTEGAWRLNRRQPQVRVFVAVLLTCACASALLASWLPLQLSIITVFLFAGPHNWFELRYFLMRLPVRFGKSRNFFLIAFAGIGFLTTAYAAMPVLYNFGAWPDRAWPTVLASWNTLLLLWLGLLVWLRGKQKLRRDWSWAMPVAFALSALNWMAPEFFSLAIVYLHPLIALWFLDRHLRRTRPEWLRAYHRCLGLLPLVFFVMFWQLTKMPSLADDNGLFWRITQHAGAQLLPGVSGHLLVSTHVFLEMLHYGVWLFALPLIARPTPSKPREIWNVRSIPFARHPRWFSATRCGRTCDWPGRDGCAVVWFLGGLLNHSRHLFHRGHRTRPCRSTVSAANVMNEPPRPKDRQQKK